MSRCFPFPPSGYERRPRVDDGSLLAKGKNKEKRHKKDKGKEKKRKKERDNERSKDKHGDKSKEKKEKRKHKDNDEKKNEDQSRDKRLRSEDLVNNGGSNSSQSSQLTGSSCGDAPDGRISHVNSLNDIARGRGEPLGNLHTGNNNFWHEDKPGLVKKADAQKDNSQTRSVKVPIVSEVGKRKVEIIRSLERINGQRTKEKERQNDHGTDKMVENGWKYKDGNEKNGEGEVERWEKGKATTQNRAESIGKMANGNVTDLGNGFNNNLRSARVAYVQNSKGLGGRGCEIGLSDMGKKAPLEGAERNAFGGRGNEIGNEEKMIQPTNGGRSEVWEEDGTKQRNDNFVNVFRLRQSGEYSTDTSRQSAANEGIAAMRKAPKEMVAKRNTPEANGLSYCNEGWHNKLAKSVASSLKPFEDGRDLQASPTIIPTATEGKSDSLKLNNKEKGGNAMMICNQESLLRSIKPPFAVAKASNTVGAQESSIGLMKLKSSMANGIVVMGSEKSHIDPQKSHIDPPKSQSSLGLTKPPSFIRKANETLVAQESHITLNEPTFAHGSPPDPEKPSTCVKPNNKHKEKPHSKPPPPHPDDIYFCKLLSIPKVDEWLGYGDQEWLFETSKKTKGGPSTGQGEDLQVWAKVVHIESADVCALPYVIPY